jgi:hypothetical protein
MNKTKYHSYIILRLLWSFLVITYITIISLLGLVSIGRHGENMLEITDNLNLFNLCWIQHSMMNIHNNKRLFQWQIGLNITLIDILFSRKEVISALILLLFYVQFSQRLASSKFSWKPIKLSKYVNAINLRLWPS